MLAPRSCCAFNRKITHKKVILLRAVLTVSYAPKSALDP